MSAPYGATVYTFVALNAVGEGLHRLESRPDVFLVHRKAIPHQNRERWLLRSDSFPAGWEGFEVILNTADDADGIESFTPILRIDE